MSRESTTRAKDHVWGWFLLLYFHWLCASHFRATPWSARKITGSGKDLSSNFLLVAASVPQANHLAPLSLSLLNWKLRADRFALKSNWKVDDNESNTYWMAGMVGIIFTYNLHVLLDGISDLSSISSAVTQMRKWGVRIKNLSKVIWLVSVQLARIEVQICVPLLP